MANHFSALKRARQTDEKTATNRANKSRLRSALRSMREAIENGDKAAAKTALAKSPRPWIRASRRACCTRTPPAATKPASTSA